MKIPSCEIESETAVRCAEPAGRHNEGHYNMRLCAV